MINGDFSCGEIKEKQYAFEATFNRNKEKLKVLVYFGKTGVKTVLQGDKDSPIYLEINSKIRGDRFFDLTNEKISEPEEYIGTDESGKGDFFGPLVIAGVIVNTETSQRLLRAGIKDSKLLSDITINTIVPEILDIIKDDFNIITITPSTYNTLHTKMGNLNRLLGWAHAKVIENLLEKRNVNEAISDKFGDESYIIRNLGEKGKTIRLQQFTKAERFTGVAAASILARYSFNKWFLEMKAKGVELPKGASSIVDKKVREIKQIYDLDYLRKIAKVHFKTTNK